MADHKKKKLPSNNKNPQRPNYQWLTIFLLLAVALEWFLLNLSVPSLQGAVIAFGVTGWSLTFGGLSLYMFKSRPALLQTHA